MYYSNFNLTVIYAQLKNNVCSLWLAIWLKQLEIKLACIEFFLWDKYIKHSRLFARRMNHHQYYRSTHQGHSQSFQSQREALWKLRTSFNISNVTWWLTKVGEVVNVYCCFWVIYEYYCDQFKFYLVLKLEQEFYS